MRGSQLPERQAWARSWKQQTWAPLPEQRESCWPWRAGDRAPGVSRKPMCEGGSRLPPAPKCWSCIRYPQWTPEVLPGEACCQPMASTVRSQLRMSRASARSASGFPKRSSPLEGCVPGWEAQGSSGQLGKDDEEPSQGAQGSGRNAVSPPPPLFPHPHLGCQARVRPCSVGPRGLLR